MTTMSAANYDPMQQQYQQRHQQQQQQQHHHQQQQHQQLGHNNGDPKEPNIFIPDIIEERKKVPEGYAVVHKFACGKLLGKGGFARCYIGTSLTTNGKYALKIVPKCNIVKPRAKQKLQSEIKIHRALSHENIVKFDRCFEDAHNAYILLELCSNNSMSEMMKKRRKLIEPEVRYYIAHLVNSLQYLHRNLVIHRDLKLGNLFIDGLMRLKVGDFGLAAKLIDPDEKRKTVCGTPNYIAPEILSNKDGHSFEVDIWSTGVVMYTLLVGKPPFETKDVKSTYRKITECSYVFPDGCGVSENAISLIRSMLQLRPERRPSLEEILDHPFFTHPSSYLPPSLPESSLREAPVFNVTSSNNNDIARKPTVSSSSSSSSSSSNSNGNSNAISKSSLRFGDENDPGAVNRMSNGSHGSSNNNNNNLDSNNNYYVVKPSIIAGIDAVSSQSQQGSGATSKPFYSRQSSADVAKSTGASSNITTTSSNSNSNSRPLSASSGSSGAKVNSKSEARPKTSSPNSISPPSSTSSSSSSHQHHSNNIVESISSSKTSSSSTSVGSNLTNPNRLSSGSSGSNNGGLAHQNHQGKSQSSTSGAIQSNSSSGVTSTASSVSTKLGFEIYTDVTTTSSTIANTTTASTGSKQSVPSSGSNKVSEMQPTKQAYYSNGVLKSSSSDNMSSSGSVVSATSTVKSGMSYGSNGSSTTAHSAAEGKVSSGSSSSVVAKPYLTQSAVDAVNDGYLNRHLIQSKQSQTKQQQQQQQQQQEINSAVDDIQQDIENIRVDDKPNEDIDYSRKSGGDDFLNRFGVNSNNSNNNNANINNNKPKGPVDLTKKPQAWAWDDDNTDNNSKGGASSLSNKGGMSDNKVVAERQSQIPNVMLTPAANIIPPSNGNEQINTLEAMHKMLDNSYINTHSPTGNKNYLVKNFSSKANGGGNISITEENLVSKVWVVRYVDYTSKYGLGFLLNTGSSGVYFNDSTKIILSADGSVFQYIERRKKESTSSSSSSEHVIQAHLMTAYPMELQKKVLLLRHFRNYLIEQQKASAEKQDELDNYSEPIHSLPMLADTGVSGANPNIAFGFSSVVARGFDEDVEEMTYVKKWVRTRHAILFRLSNKTVQIVFFDRSEIVLSSEARVVTYVNKQGLRSEFSLEEVMQDGRADIAKRLRYTKDIMYRLINSQPNR